MRCKSVLLRTLVAASGAKMAGIGVARPTRFKRVAFAFERGSDLTHKTNLY